MAIKPILFNTEMVRAILDGRKCLIILELDGSRQPSVEIVRDK